MRVPRREATDSVARPTPVPSQLERKAKKGAGGSRGRVEAQGYESWAKRRFPRSNLYLEKTLDKEHCLKFSIPIFKFYSFICQNSPGRRWGKVGDFACYA
ncbi:Hypothetical predicted protein [Podarcis lilfordi]|uniref:Uncharacterized protein n=1 Tax=Podarcis lilfordi TaxID=74358 RepID=A0AA35K5P0_9SAUR|nr:Hypothetical predicted protein [Podarcis lilfordi]